MVHCHRRSQREYDISHHAQRTKRLSSIPFSYSSTFLGLGLAAPGPVGMISPLSSRTLWKYDMAFCRPFLTATLGSHPILSLAMVISGLLWEGSSVDLGRLTILELLL